MLSDRQARRVRTIERDDGGAVRKRRRKIYFSLTETRKESSDEWTEGERAEILEIEY